MQVKVCIILGTVSIPADPDGMSRLLHLNTGAVLQLHRIVGGIRAECTRIARSIVTPDK